MVVQPVFGQQNMTRLDAINFVAPGAPRIASERSTAPGWDTGRASPQRVATQGLEALSTYCIDLNQKASEGKIDPLIGRSD